MIYIERRPFHKAGMRCGKSLSDGRALALALALFAITLNFLQPLVHAAVMRDGAPEAVWKVLCKTEPGSQQDPLNPLAAGQHECCLGLAHAAAFPMTSAEAAAIERPGTTVRPLQAAEVAISVGIRDGPHRPRGPPSLV